MNKENIEALLKDYQCPYMGTDLVSGNTVKEIKVEGNNVFVKCVLGWPAEGIMQAFHENMDKKIKLTSRQQKSVITYLLMKSDFVAVNN